MTTEIPRKVKVRYGIGVTLVVALLVAYSGWMAGKRRQPQVEPSEFAQLVELETLENIAVHSDGRIKSFASYANEMMNWVTGPRSFEGQAPAFTFLDLMFRPEHYEDAPVLYVKHKGLREEIIDGLEGSVLAEQHGPAQLDDLDERIAWLRETGMLSPMLLGEPKVMARLSQLRGDVLRWEKHIDSLDSALTVRGSQFLASRLNIIPPEGGDTQAPWLNIREAQNAANHPEHEGHESHAADFARVAGAGRLWDELASAWGAADGPAVNAAASALSAELVSLNPELYPSVEKLSWESWYFRAKNLVWVWIVFFLSVVLLLLGIVYGWRKSIVAGNGVFAVAFLLQTFAVGLRWWVSGRWPNSNMFEAVTTSAWFGSATAVVAALWLWPRSRRKGGGQSEVLPLIILAAAVSSMIALMCAHFLPLQLNPNISNMMPVLHDVWLYIHTNVIIWAYILIFMAAVPSTLYLIWRMAGGPRTIVPVGGMALLGEQRQRGELQATAPLALDPDADEPAGEATTLQKLQQLQAANAVRHTDHGAVLDGVSMFCMKLSFVMLWAGLVMGAIWADHSWGRPWGWDPKETFALNTFLVFAVLVHVRFKVRDKAFWTAVLILIGAGVTLFNWIVINFAISGLHSYA